jgi:hypothetical protein
LPPDDVERHGPLALEQRHLVVADNREGVQTADEIENTGAVGSAVDEVSAEREPMPDRIEPSDAQQVAQLGGTTLNITHEQSVAHVYDPCLSAYSNKPGTPREQKEHEETTTGRLPPNLATFT